MKKKMIFSLMMLSACVMLFVSGCKKDDEEEDTPPPTMSDDSFYKDIAVGLINCYVDIYNQNLAGTTTGNVNITVNGPMGGTVTITGTSGYDNTHGITTLDLLYTMTNIKYVNAYVNLTLTGGSTYTGSFSDDYTSVNHQSDNLYIKGTVTRNTITRAIDMTGEVSINRTTGTTAIIFGHTVIW